jgi:stalled ribosome rescue protein Dom34
MFKNINKGNKYVAEDKDEFLKAICALYQQMQKISTIIIYLPKTMKIQVKRNSVEENPQTDITFTCYI